MLFQQRIYHRFCLTIFELIISTINLPTVTMPVAYVTAFFNDADIKRVTEMVITEKLHHATSRVVEILMSEFL